MRKLLIPAILFLIFNIQSAGQANNNQGAMILFQGIVMDAEKQIPLPDAQIFIGRAFYSVSDREGKFGFYISKRDTVTFRVLGYKAAVMLISDTLRGREFIAGVYLHIDTLSIGEVVIIPRLSNLKSDLLGPLPEASRESEYAKYNLEISSYQAKVNQNKLGDPASNYEVLRQKQREDAYSKGQIPPDRMVGLNPLLLIPAAYMLLHGMPEKPLPPEQNLTEKELDELHEKYMETCQKK